MIQGGSKHYSPFLARVTSGVGGTEEFICSGTVIAPEWVLTAGHCVGEVLEVGGKTFPASYFKVYTGNINWTKATVSTVSQALRNAGYYSNHTVPPDDDVGLLHLSSPLTVEPIVLATPASFAKEVTLGAPMSATGWGLTSPNGQVVPEESYLVTGLVVEYFPEHEAGENNDVVIGSNEQKGTCPGDSGGPFIDKAGEEVAITSAGPANACNQTDAQRIDLIDPWITENVEKTEPPTVSSISPTSGVPGTEVVIHGFWMDKATGVSFGSTPATKFTIVSSNEVKATAPAGIGTVDVRVTNAHGTSAIVSGDKFQHTALPPSVTKVEPTSGPEIGWTKVTITGTEFTGATKVHFGTKEAKSFTVDSETSITAVSPLGAKGTVNVTVTTPAGTSAETESDHFEYQKGPKPTDYKLCTTFHGQEECSEERFEVFKKAHEFRLPPEGKSLEEGGGTYTSKGKDYTFTEELEFERQFYKIELAGVKGKKGVIAGEVLEEVGKDGSLLPIEETFTLTPEKA